MHMAPMEGHSHMQMHRAPASRMVRTMSVPHMAMGPGQHQPMYSEYNGQVSRSSPYLLHRLFLKFALIYRAVTEQSQKMFDGCTVELQSKSWVRGVM